MPPYVPSWGNVIAGGKNVIREAFWVSLFPGIALDTLDPRLRVQ